MKDWDPQLYRRFESERTRPALELLARIPLFGVNSASDLGCGPGNSTELLHQAWPEAVISGIDTSPSMLEQARQRLPDCHFIQADISRWQPSEPQDIIYANASLQWLTEHNVLFPYLVTQLSAGGVLAVQMPDNLHEPSHSLMRQVASQPEWRDVISHAVADRKKLLSAEAYYDLLTVSGCEVDLWRTTYYHVMDSPAAIVDWLRATGLRPFLAGLNDVQQTQFLASYLAALTEAYPPRHDGRCLLAFPRLFIVARRLS